jgi:hypothetical protein
LRKELKFHEKGEELLDLAWYYYYYLSPIIIIIIIIIIISIITHHHHHHHHHHELGSIRRSACSLSLEMKLVLPSFPWASYASFPVWPIFQCLFGYPVCHYYC